MHQLTFFFFFNRDPLSRVREIQMSSQNIQGQTAAVPLWEGWAPRPRGKKESWLLVNHLHSTTSRALRLPYLTPSSHSLGRGRTGVSISTQRCGNWGLEVTGPVPSHHSHPWATEFPYPGASSKFLPSASFRDILWNTHKCAYLYVILLPTSAYYTLLCTWHAVSWRSF